MEKHFLPKLDWQEGSLSQIKDAALGVHADLDDPATLTVQQNFTAWWNIWRASGYNRGVVRRDYAQLDRIFPDRIRTAEEFLRRQDQQLRERGSSLWEKMINNKPILKIHEDGKR
ncbi:hypothetical protein LA080_000963 [Diaporthe eres]|uniref:Uncharacterized protein n=1 Tax=Diaporthe vaccinii TaxID=105482 RepID=A0ABR4FD42_9PEZI|nr:hypothetical protein LA080_000963 [Diaporthe eres]